MKLDNIPIALMEHPYWCAWSKWDGRKMPINPNTRKLAKANDPGTFADFDCARHCYKSRSYYEGVGV